MLRLITPLLVAAGIALAAGTPAVPGARADSPSTLTIVGPQVLSDSQLMNAVIKPGFEAANPQYTVSYVTQPAANEVSYGETGDVSVILGSSEPREQAFVSADYSEEPSGRAALLSDEVLLGPSSDPAQVQIADPHDIVDAMNEVSAAGESDEASFVSRTGAADTAVLEHRLWSLSTGVPVCTVDPAGGGGSEPSTTPGSCPSTPTPPPWYEALANVSAAQVIEQAAACPYPSGACYVLADRATFDYLAAQKPNPVAGLRVLSQDPATGSGASSFPLATSIHAYAVSDGPFSGQAGDTPDVTGGLAFLDWLTSPAAQSAIDAYLRSGGASPFVASAAPRLTLVTPSVTSGRAVTVHGAVTNVVPGTPAIARQQVDLLVKPAGSTAAPTQVATTMTSSTGQYSFRYTPTSTGTFTVTTPAFTQTEDSTVSPPYDDQLMAATLTGHRSVLRARVRITKVHVHKRAVTLTGVVGPAPTDTTARLWVYACHRTGCAPKLITHREQGVRRSGFVIHLSLRRGLTWRIRLRYSTGRQFAAASTPVRRVSVRYGT